MNVVDAGIRAQGLFSGRLQRFDCEAILDADADGSLDAADPVTILKWLFLGGPAPPPPFEDCGLPDGPVAGEPRSSCNESNCRVQGAPP